ncbi:hypothetical protein V5093_21705 [Enterobacter cancerogenus]|uniref:hypothetical protein n=1 Tax=Enterobacter cancerogenus TaxID=69218 RepID=UPI003075F887
MNKRLYRTDRIYGDQATTLINLAQVASVDTGDRLTVSAERDLSITDTADSSEFESHHKSSGSSGVLSKKAALRWDDIGLGIYEPSTSNPLPGIIGTGTGGSSGEIFNVLVDPNGPLRNKGEK